MALQNKYYYYFKDIYDVQFKVEIWQDTETILTAEEIKGDESPFSVTYTQANKFDVVLGSGCDISILSESNMKFLDLYTSDMMENQIRFYSGSTLLWIGYLNSELYSEPFDSLTNYKVSLTGNDGLALLERMDYFDSNGVKYTGIDTNWNIIKSILLKLSIPWTKVYVGLSTTSSELTIGTSDTILSKTYSYNENYYNEDGNNDDKAGSMTCKEIVETILKPFAASIIIINSNVYIYDTNTLAAGGNQTFRVYNGTTLNYETNATINLSLGDVSDIKFSLDQQTLNVLSQVNKQKITFSPYINRNEDTFIDYDPIDDTFSGTPSTYTYGTAPNTWTETAYPYSTQWDKAYPDSSEQTRPRFSVLTGTGDNEGDEDKYLTIGGSITPYLNYFTYKGIVPKVILNSSKTYYFKIEASCYIRTTDDMNNGSDFESYNLRVKTNLSIGDKSYRLDPTYHGADGWYQNNTETLMLNFTNMTKGDIHWQLNNISDTWTQVSKGWMDWEDQSVIKPDKDLSGIYIPLNTSTAGNTFSFSIGGYYVYDKNSTYDPYVITPNVKDVRIKDIRIKICDENFKEINLDDKEHNYWVNLNIKDNGEDIALNLGTNIDLNPLSIGGILGLNGSSYWYITKFTRAGTIDEPLEHLLARSVISNYTPKTLEILCSINRIPTIFGVLTYNNYLDGNFSIQSALINYSESTIELTLQQIQVDNPDLILNEIN